MLVPLNFGVGLSAIVLVFSVLGWALFGLKGPPGQGEPQAMISVRPEMGLSYLIWAFLVPRRATSELKTDPGVGTTKLDFLLFSVVEFVPISKNSGSDPNIFFYYIYLYGGSKCNTCVVIYQTSKYLFLFCYKSEYLCF